jgi:hypothetical protein
MLNIKRQVRLWLWGMSVLWASVLAQQIPEGRTVQELIQTLKDQRARQLEPQTQPAGQKQPQLQTQTKRGGSSSVAHGNWAMLPLLWSLSGLNEGFTAVLVIERGVHVIKSQSLPVSVKGWQVRSMDAHGVHLVRGGEKLHLQAPSEDHSVDPFLNALPPQDRQGTTSMEPATDSPPTMRSAIPMSMTSQDLATQAQQLAAPLPLFEFAPAAKGSSKPPVPKESR